MNNFYFSLRHRLSKKVSDRSKCIIAILCALAFAISAIIAYIGNGPRMFVDFSLLLTIVFLIISLYYNRIKCGKTRRLTVRIRAGYIRAI